MTMDPQRIGRLGLALAGASIAAWWLLAAPSAMQAPTTTPAEVRDAP